jgi:hypothetical protein
LPAFDFGKVRETWYGGDKICGAKSRYRATLRDFRGHGDGAARRKDDQARALRRSVNVAMRHDRIPSIISVRGHGEMAERIRAASPPSF